MKTTITTLLLLISILSFAQEISGVTIANNKPIYTEDSYIYIRHLNSKNDIKNDVAVLINGDFIKNGYSLLKTLNPNIIESVNVKKNEITIDGTKYSAQLIIGTKSDYKPSIITLNNLISKHLTLDNNPIILKIDGDYVNEDLMTTSLMKNLFYK